MFWDIYYNLRDIILWHFLWHTIFFNFWHFFTVYYTMTFSCDILYYAIFMACYYDFLWLFYNILYNDFLWYFYGILYYFFFITSFFMTFIWHAILWLLWHTVRDNQLHFEILTTEHKEALKNVTFYNESIQILNIWIHYSKQVILQSFTDLEGYFFSW